MAGRGAQTFQKRQKEQQRKERQQEKFARKLERKNRVDEPETGSEIKPEEDAIGEPSVESL